MLPWTWRTFGSVSGRFALIHRSRVRSQFVVSIAVLPSPASSTAAATGPSRRRVSPLSCAALSSLAMVFLRSRSSARMPSVARLTFGFRGAPRDATMRAELTLTPNTQFASCWSGGLLGVLIPWSPSHRVATSCPLASLPRLVPYFFASARSTGSHGPETIPVPKRKTESMWSIIKSYHAHARLLQEVERRRPSFTDEPEPLPAPPADTAAPTRRTPRCRPRATPPPIARP